MADLSLKELKDILDDNELDLSARGLTAIPKAITQIPRATNIDLNSNKISFLLPEFCNMTKIVKLDLGSNNIIFLPDNFGNLVHLQQLILYNNEIENLPMSFANLKALKYLDLKRNPLEPTLLKAAGPCNSEKECKQAAVNVRDYMKKEKMVLDAAVAKQDKVNQKIQAKNAEAKKAAKAKNNVDKKKQSKKETVAAAVEPVENVSEKMSKKDKKEDSKKQATRAKSQSSSWISSLIYWAFYLSIIVFSVLSVTVVRDCYNGGGTILRGAKPFCADMTKLKNFEKPSDKFFQNTKATYRQSYFHTRDALSVQAKNLQSTAVSFWNNFDKYPAVKEAKKHLIKAHEVVADYAFYLFTRMGNAYDDVRKWYETEGHKQIGAYLDPVIVALKMSYEIAKDLVLIAFESVASFLQRSTIFIQSLLVVWQEKGFAAAIDAAFQH